MRIRKPVWIILVALVALALSAFMAVNQGEARLSQEPDRLLRIG